MYVESWAVWMICRRALGLSARMHSSEGMGIVVGFGNMGLWHANGAHSMIYWPWGNALGRPLPGYDRLCLLLC